MPAMLTAQDNLAALVAASARFVTESNSLDTAEALTKVHIQVEKKANLDWNVDLAHWYALVVAGPNDRQSVAGGGANTYADDGTLRLCFIAPIAAGEQSNDNAAYRTFAAAVDVILSEMEALSGTDTYFQMNSIAVADGPLRSLEEEAATQGHYLHVWYDIGWGI